MSQPEIKAKVHAPEVRAKAGLKLRGRKNPAHSQLMRERNPMRIPEVRARARATLIAMGHGFKERGGNGKGPTPSQSALLKLLERRGFVDEFVVNLNRARIAMPETKMPTHYKIDIANEKRMIAVEVDGRTHDNPKRFESDSRKDHILSFLGWKVIRVKNYRALSESKTVSREILDYKHIPKIPAPPVGLVSGYFATHPRNSKVHVRAGHESSQAICGIHKYKGEFVLRSRNPWQHLECENCKKELTILKVPK